MKPGDIGHTLAQGEDVIGVLVIEEGLVVQVGFLFLCLLKAVFVAEDRNDSRISR